MFSDPHMRRSDVQPTAQMGRNNQCICRVLCVTANSEARCPLWVKSGHFGMSDPCPLYPQKRTLVEPVVMSALCQKQTFTAPDSITTWRGRTRSLRAPAEAHLRGTSSVRTS